MSNEQLLEPTLIRIGANLYILRHLRREKMDAVAKAIGVTHPVISKIENGRYKCLSLEILIKLASHYQVSLEDLVRSKESL